MFNESFLEPVSVIRVANAEAAGQTQVVGASIDLADPRADAVCFVALLGTVNATAAVKLGVELSDDDATFAAPTDPAVAETESVTDTDSDNTLAVDVIRPATRYVRPVVTRDTADAEIDGILALVYRTRKQPVAQDDTLAKSLTLNSPE